MATLNMKPLGSTIEGFLSDEDRLTNRGSVEELETSLRTMRETVHQGWGERATARVHQKGKLTTWERISRLKDPGTTVFEVGTLVNWGREFAGSRREAPGAGVVTCFVRVAERWCVVIANENTVASGAWWPLTPEKIERAQSMALKLRLPLIYLVDCSGLFLPEQARSFSGRTGAGHIFTYNARIADAGVPQIAGVFGDCIAGGGYMPIISDRVYMTEGAYMVIAGAALIKGAKSQNLTSLDIGGPEVHVHLSGCADVRVPNDEVAIEMIRNDVACLPSSAVEFYRHGASPMEPTLASSEISEMFPTDFRQTYDIEQVIARLVDQSLFREVLGGYGREMVTGIARISGLWVGIIANRQGIIDEPGVGKRPGGALYREGITKISSFARACSEDGIPLIWLQDISGFDIGEEAEAQGLLGYGSSLIYANSTPRNPVFTILLRKASGAGFYAMSGMPYEPVVQLSTPISRLAVMEGRTLAIATYNSKLNDEFEIATEDPEERRQIAEGMEAVEARINSDMDPIRAAASMDTDEVVCLGELRSWLCCLTEAAWQGAGYRRTKNPRIWSIHDLCRVGGLEQGKEVVALSESGALIAPTPGRWVPAIDRGFEVRPGELLGHIHQGDSSIPVVSPKIFNGFVRPELAGEWVQCGDVLARHIEEFSVGQVADEQAAERAGLPDGIRAIVAETDGTIYLSPEPSSPAFVSIGDKVRARSTLALIEVMKTFTPVRSSIEGQLERVLVEDGEAVTAGQVLMWLRQ